MTLQLRTETDTLGTVTVPATAYYGAQTTRAINNFPISGQPISRFPDLIKSLAYIKWSAAKVNMRLGLLDRKKGEIICQVCDEIIKGDHLDQFPIDLIQGGAGTSTNMNMNEVIANRGLEIMGEKRGHYQALHPNDDVNMSQSTNDVYPTAVRLAILFTHERLVKSISVLCARFKEKGVEFKDIKKVGRTQLQDAVPMTLGEEFQAFASTLEQDISLIKQAVLLVQKVNLGGTAIGTGINAKPEYQKSIVEELSEATGLSLEQTPDKIAASWDMGAFVSISGVLKRTAINLSKICNDLRLLSSGPRGGLHEINLPAMQPGSSIMPGKINPVIPEVVNQTAFLVMGNDQTITLAAEAGQLQLNAMEPVIAFKILESMEFMSNAIHILAEKCVAGITANKNVCLEFLESSTAMVTAMSQQIGYEKAAQLAKEIIQNDLSFSEALEKHKEINAEKFI